RSPGRRGMPLAPSSARSLRASEMPSAALIVPSETASVPEPPPGGWLRLALKHRRALTVAVNLAVALAAYALAVGLRFDFHLPEDFVPLVPITLVLLLGGKLFAFWATGLFKGWWRHVSIRDVEDIVRGNVLGSTLFLCAMVFGVGLHHFPRSVFLLDLIICTTLM